MAGRRSPSITSKPGFCRSSADSTWVDSSHAAARVVMIRRSVVSIVISPRLADPGGPWQRRLRRLRHPQRRSGAGGDGGPDGVARSESPAPLPLSIRLASTPSAPPGRRQMPAELPPHLGHVLRRIAPTRPWRRGPPVSGWSARRLLLRELRSSSLWRRPSSGPVQPATALDRRADGRVIEVLDVTAGRAQLDTDTTTWPTTTRPGSPSDRLGEWPRSRLVRPRSVHSRRSFPVGTSARSIADYPYASRWMPGPGGLRPRSSFESLDRPVRGRVRSWYQNQDLREQVPVRWNATSR